MERERRFSVYPILACFCGGALYGWGGIAPEVQHVFAAATAQTGFAFSVAIASFTGAVLVAPALCRRIGHARVLAASCALAGGCVGLAAIAPHLILFIACFSVGFGFASGTIYSAALALAAVRGDAWLATPVTVATFGLGGVAFGPLWAMLAARGWGLAAMWPLAGALMLVGFLVLIKAPVSAVFEAGPSRRLPSSWQAKQALFLVWCVFALGAFAGLMILGLAGNILADTGAGTALTGMALAGLAAGNTLGRLSAAFMVRASPVPGLCASCAFTCLGLLPGLWAMPPPWLGAGLVAIAFGYGLMASAIPLLTVSLFGKERFQAAYGLIFTAWGASGIVAPWLSGALFDMTGRFVPGFTVATAATLCVLPLLVWVGRLQQMPILADH